MAVNGKIGGQMEFSEFQLSKVESVERSVAVVKTEERLMLSTSFSRLFRFYRFAIEFNKNIIQFWQFFLNNFRPLSILSTRPTPPLSWTTNAVVSLTRFLAPVSAARARVEPNGFPFSFSFPLPSCHHKPIGAVHRAERNLEHVGKGCKGRGTFGVRRRARVNKPYGSTLWYAWTRRYDRQTSVPVLDNEPRWLMQNVSWPHRILFIRNRQRCDPQPLGNLGNRHVRR